MSWLPRARRKLLASLALMTIVLAGCSGGGGKDTDGDAPGVVDVDGERIAADRGILVGRVLNDAGLGLDDARVSLLKTDFFADTDGRGAFRFVNVTAGPHTLSVQAQGFQPYTQDLEVAAANVTNVTIQLVPDRQAGAGYAPHIHDRWQGQAEYVLMDSAVDLGRPVPSQTDWLNEQLAPVMASLVRPNAGGEWPVPILDTPHEGPPIVLPGTAEMEVTLSWDSTEVGVDAFGFAYTSAASFSPTALDPQPSGETFTIPVNQTMADSGHQLFSLWTFSVWTDNSATSGTTEWSPQYVAGDLHVKVVLRKGDLFLEPVHEDFWQGKDSLVLRTLEQMTSGGSVCCTNYRDADGGMRFDEGNIVPPGADRLRVDFRWAYDDGTNGTAADLDWELTWRTGSQNPHTTSIEDFSHVEASEGSKDAHRKVYEIALDEDDTDAFYQSKTNWLFVPWAQPYQEAGPFFDRGTVEFRMHVTAYRG